MTETHRVFASSDNPRVSSDTLDIGPYDPRSSVVDQHKISIREDWVVVEAPESEMLRELQTKGPDGPPGVAQDIDCLADHRPHPANTLETHLDPTL